MGLKTLKTLKTLQTLALYDFNDVDDFVLDIQYCILLRDPVLQSFLSLKILESIPVVIQSHTIAHGYHHILHAQHMLSEFEDPQAESDPSLLSILQMVCEARISQALRRFKTKQTIAFVVTHACHYSKSIPVSGLPQTPRNYPLVSTFFKT